MKISHIPIFLSIISIAMLLTGFKKPAPSTTAPQALHKGTWSMPIGIGINWKPKAEATNNAWMGCVATIGIKWNKVWCKRYTFSAGLLWGLFLPDMFMANKPKKFHINIFNLKIVIPYTLRSFYL